jgi:hypothetical protein
LRAYGHSHRRPAQIRNSGTTLTGPAARLLLGVAAARITYLIGHLASTAV